MAWSKKSEESLLLLSEADEADARAVGPAVSAAIRDKRPTWEDDRGANFSYETLGVADEDGRAFGGGVNGWDAMVTKRSFQKK